MPSVQDKSKSLTMNVFLSLQSARLQSVTPVMMELLDLVRIQDPVVNSLSLCSGGLDAAAHRP